MNDHTVDDAYYDAAPEERVAQPLSDTTRRDRTALLAANVVLFAAVQGGIVPTRVSALGLETTNVNTGAILLLVHAVVLYFLMAFALYAWSDYRVWGLRLVWLKRWRNKPYEKLLSTEYYVDVVEQTMRETRNTNFVSDELISEMAAEVGKNMKEKLHKISESAWSRHVRPFKLRSHFEFWLPILLTLGNLLGSAFHLMRII